MTPPLLHRYSPKGESESKSINLIQRKLARARFIASRLATVPFIRLLALTNSVAMGTATELSDLDFFVVTTPNRLWTARFLLLLTAKWLGVSKRPGKTADQADFGWWIDETALDLAPIALDSDPLLSRILATMIPLVDRGGVYERLLSANVKLMQPTEIATPSKVARDDQPLRLSLRGQGPWQSLIVIFLGSRLGGLIEYLLFIIQRAKIWAEPITHHPSPLTRDGRRIDVVTTRHMLKLHHFDQRAKVFDQWQAAKNKNERP